MNTKIPKPRAWTPFFRRFTDERASDLRDTKKLYNEVTATWRQSMYADPTALDHFVTVITDQLPLPEGPFATRVQETVRNLLMMEDIVFTSPHVDWNSLPLKSQVELRRFLRAQQHFLAHHEQSLGLIGKSIHSMMRTVMTELPTTTGQSYFSMPLYDAVPDMGRCIEYIYGDFVTEENHRAGLFGHLTNQCSLNGARFSGIDLHDDKKDITPPSESKLSPADMVTAYLAHTPLFELFNQQVPFSIGKKNYCRHGICVARPGWGKSQLLGVLLREAIEDPDPRSAILIDPHGPLYNEARQRTPPERTVLIDCDTNPPDLNIFDFGVSTPEDALNTFEFLLSSLAGGLTEKQQSCVEPLFALLTQIPRATLETLHDIVVERPSKKQSPKYAAEITKLDKIHAGFFNLFYGTSDFDITKSALQWKISRALSRPAFRQMFSAPKNSIDLDRFIREKKIILVKGGEKALGREGMRILLLYLLSQFYAAGKRREGTDPNTWHLAQMLIDEAHLVLQSNLIKPVLQELRKFNFSFMAATQLWDDVSKEVKPAILGATAIKIIGDVQRDDAEVFARDMHSQGSFIQSLRQVDRSHAEWAIFVTGLTDKAVRVRCPYGVLEQMPRCSSGPTPSPQSATVAAQAPPSPPPMRPGARETSPGSGPLIKPGKQWD